MISRTEGKLNSEYGMKDYYKYYSNNYPYKVDRKIYNDVVSILNKFVVDEIVDTAKEFILPHRTGSIEIIKRKSRIKILADNSLYNTSPVDWKATNELWNNDIEAKERKILVRYKNTHTGNYVYSIKYNKYNSVFTNRRVMAFTPNRQFKRDIAKRIRDYSKEKYNANEQR